MKWLIVSCLCCINFALIGQESGMLDGRIVSGEKKLGVAYAKVYNTSCAQGVITNEDGYFSIPSDFVFDTLLISCFGFQARRVVVNDERFLEVDLTGNVQLVDEVVASAKSHEELYQLLECAMKRHKWEEYESRAYFELSTYANSERVELIQAYFNAHSNAADLKKLELKAGRIALRPFGTTNFVSLESSRALAMMQLFEKNDYYPALPTNLRGKKLRRAFRVIPEGEEVELDSTVLSVIHFLPIDPNVDGFSGKIWVEKESCRIRKIQMHTDSASIHPFLPLFAKDTIRNVGITITRTYEPSGNTVRLNHIDFEYSVDYKSRDGYAYPGDLLGLHAGQSYQMNTKALIYFYKYDDPFSLPGFEFPKTDIGDYRKISGIPYNAFFWEENNEYSMKESKDENAMYFLNSPQSTKESFKVKSGQEEKKLFEKPYIRWSPNRILFREQEKKTSTYAPLRTEVNAAKYNLDFQLYADVNTYGDSTNILTATICDPYESYYLLPLDQLAHCFINLYFDLMEIKRRELEELMLSAVEKGEDPMVVYNDFIEALKPIQNQFFKEMQRGTNTVALKKWSAFVFEKLGIDNISIFGLTGDASGH